MPEFLNELDFEKAIMGLLPHKGWEPTILKNKTEKELIDNWAGILYQNNKSIDKLNNVPLTDSEMGQILDDLKARRTPHKIHSFINGKSTLIVRDNPLDSLHLGKEVSLKIYDRNEIAGGQSTYQIVEQPRFERHHPLANERRGDFTLLINGMPVIHVELKKSREYLQEGINQIIKYTNEGVFSGIYSLVQIFVVMTPEETVYFANPGKDGKFLREFMFHWEDFNNEPVNDWRAICEQLLSIPMAHELIGYYTVADNTDDCLKVLRSYQYNAVKQISKVVSETTWDHHDSKGGYIWHTTGSGKTLTSFKAAQLIASSGDADKVVFLMDRIELGTQSLDDYKNFADDNETVVGTKSSSGLKGKLLSDNLDETLIVSSIQKLSIISKENAIGDSDMEKINKKRIVIIVDECHRSTFGDMMADIKAKFKTALFFGFSGTPIQKENSKKELTTADIFGKELHRYTIADGIRDNNVLGFDPELILTFSKDDLKKAVALGKSKAATEEEALNDPEKRVVFLRYLNEVPMVGYFDEAGNYVKGIEDEIPDSQYCGVDQKHKKTVVEDILKKWVTRSLNKFHAIFATSSINEAIEYFYLFKEYLKKDGYPKINVTAVFDPTIDNNDGFVYKESGLIDIIDSYNKTFGQHFTLQTADLFRKDVCLRLAHKEPYVAIGADRDQVVDLVIVVDQLLTGFDSKWINTLYLDKMLKNERIIQAFSRTNRLFNKQEKPYGMIKIYRRPFTMEARMKEALEIYSGNKPYGVFVPKLKENLIKLNGLFSQIKSIFDSEGTSHFEKLPESHEAIAKFSKLFTLFNCLVVSSRLQGMEWNKSIYEFDDGQVVRQFSEEEYTALLQRYKEIERTGGEGKPDEPPYDIDPSITSIPADLVDANYMNSKFKKFLLVLNGGDEKARNNALDELHKTFSTLTQEEQKQANNIIHDIYSGKLVPTADKTIKDYINEYLVRLSNENLRKFAGFIGVSIAELQAFMDDVDRDNPDAFGRLTQFKRLVDRSHLRESLQKKEGHPFSVPKANIELDALIRRYIEENGFDIDE